jgi:hypothetical protein
MNLHPSEHQIHFFRHADPVAPQAYQKARLAKTNQRLLGLIRKIIGAPERVLEL